MVNLRVYSKFKSVDKYTNEIVKYRVQKLPKSHYDEAADLMTKCFIPYEILLINRKVKMSPADIKTYQDLWYKTFDEGISIVCFKEGEKDEIVGVNVLSVRSKKGDTVREPVLFPSDILQLFAYIDKQFDVYETFGVDEYLTSYGLSVDPICKGQGVATELLKARIPILKELNLPITVARFTGIQSQIAAQKAGFKDASKISYDELGKRFPSFDFSNIETKYIKKMYLKADDII